jgi:hypothetical protein
MGLGLMALSIDAGEVGEGPDAGCDPRPEGRQGGGAPRRLAGVALLDGGRKRALPLPRDAQREAARAQSAPLVLGVPAWREGRALVATGQRGKKGRGVVAERIALELTSVDHCACEGGRARVSSQPGDGRQLRPAVRTRQGFRGEVAEAGPRGPGRPSGPGPRGARPDRTVERGADQGRAHGEGPP